MATYGIQNLPSPPPPAGGAPSPAAPQPGGGDVNSLLGPQLQQQAQQQQQADLQASLQALMAQFRDMAMKIDALASQHPEAASQFRAAQSALRDAGQLVMTNLTRGQDAGMQPPVLS